MRALFETLATLRESERTSGAPAKLTNPAQPDTRRRTARKDNPSVARVDHPA